MIIIVISAKVTPLCPILMQLASDMFETWGQPINDVTFEEERGVSKMLDWDNFQGISGMIREKSEI